MVPQPSSSIVSSPPPSRGQLVLAFATLYVVWGSTYLAIRFAVGAWPPFLLAAVRFAISGALLYGFLRARGAAAPPWRQWGSALIVGSLLLGFGNGLVCWAEQWVPSNIAALIIASVPLWMTVLPWAVRRAPAPRPLVLVGVVLGMVGVAVLLGAGGSQPASAAGAPGPAFAPVALLFASLAWAVGSLWSRSLPRPASPFLSTGMQMLVTSPFLFAVAALRGELSAASRAMWAPVPLSAVAYLIVIGSIAGFGSYIWLLRHTSPARASTYAFVNPLIAVLLGWAIGHEAIGPRTFVAAPLIVLSVVAVVTAPVAARR